MPTTRIAFATTRFEESCRFYAEGLGCPEADRWERENGRARVFDLFGLRVEILDARRERHVVPGDPGDLVHLVVECEDLDSVRAGLRVETPEPVEASWGVRLFAVRDPDGIAVTFLERTGRPPARTDGPDASGQSPSR